jgi:hypothetical protein
MFQCSSLCPVGTGTKTMPTVWHRTRPIQLSPLSLSLSLLYNRVKIIVPYPCSDLHPSRMRSLERWSIVIGDSERGQVAGMNHTVFTYRLRCENSDHILVASAHTACESSVNIGAHITYTRAHDSSLYLKFVENRLVFQLISSTNIQTAASKGRFKKRTS